MKYHVHFNILIFFKREFLVDDAMGVARNKASVVCGSPSEPCCVWGDAVAALLGTAGLQEDGVGSLRPFSCLCWFAEPFNRPASFSGLTTVGSNAFGGLGNPAVSEYWAWPCCPAALHGSQGTVCSLLYCLVTSLRDGNLETDLFQISVNCFLLIT